MSRAFALARADLANFARDPMLVFISILPLLLGAAARFAVPVATQVASRWIALANHYDFMMGMLLLFVPSMLGWVAGFVLLDERDEDLLTAISVTPVGRNGFVVYRLAIPTAASFIAGFVVLGVAGLSPFHPLRLIPVAILAAAQAPLMAMFLAALANNKVEGVAIAKGASMALAAPFALLSPESSWQLLASMIPTYWVVRAYLAESWGALGWALAGGCATTAIALSLIYRLFARRVG